MDGFKNYYELKEINKKYEPTFNLPKNKKYKSNVLEYKKDYQGLHPTQKPLLLIEDLVKTYTNENDLVLDFCMGSGTTALAAKKNNRNYIGSEISAEYCKIAEERLKQEYLF